MAIAADAVIRFAERHAEKAEELAAHESNPSAKPSLERSRRFAGMFQHMRREISGRPCRPTGSSHLGVMSELNTWDSFCPGRLDQHLYPFYQQGSRRRNAHA